jgi:RES domain-containing protein
VRLWRLARQPHGLDRSGAGAFLYGGRWTPAGVRVLHAAQSISLAALEYLVHSPKPPPNLVLVAIDLPDDAPLDRPAIEKLPEDWASPLPSTDCQAWGRRWCRAGKALAIAVPSVIVPEERNYVVNVGHPRMADVRLKSIRRFAYDLRLLAR